MSGSRARHASLACSAAFATAAVIVLTANLLSPFPRGWWLAAFLFLVGGLSQLLLSTGQNALTKPRREPPAALLWTQWALWSTGTVTVATADMAQVMTGVDAGSGILLVALLLFLAGARRAGRRPHQHVIALERGYHTLLVVLAGSTILGTFLAGAIPGQ